MSDNETNNESEELIPAENLTPAADESAKDAEIEALRTQLAEMKDQLLRTMAEADNTKKRAERDIQETSRFAVSNFARDLVNVCENLHRALDSIPADKAEENDLLKNLRVGVDMTLSELTNVFGRNGITRVYPLGEKFDHNYHQAVIQVEDGKSPPGTVVQVLEAGYVLNGRLLRPAMVGVAKMDSQTKVDTAA